VLVLLLAVFDFLSVVVAVVAFAAALTFLVRAANALVPAGSPPDRSVFVL